MEKRIRLIYIFSLFAALSAIGMQGYWLYNQLQYEMQRYAKELVGKIKEVEEEYSIYNYQKDCQARSPGYKSDLCLEPECGT